MQVIQGFNVLNDNNENQKLFIKLLDWFIARWNREANKDLKEHKTYPDFKTFVTFVIAEADLVIWCATQFPPTML